MKAITRPVLGVLVVAALLAAPVNADAAVKVFWPEAFKLGHVEPVAHPERNFEAICSWGGGGSSTYYAPVRLPAGATIRGIEYLHHGVQLESATAVQLIETYYGHPGKEGTTLFNANAFMEGLKTGEDLVQQAGDFPTVRKARRYWLRVETSLACVKGVKVRYRR